MSASDLHVPVWKTLCSLSVPHFREVVTVQALTFPLDLQLIAAGVEVLYESQRNLHGLDGCGK
jgi:hypothetical protein